MEIQSNFSLKSHNTFGVDVKAKYFAYVTKMEDLKEILSNPKYKNEPKFFLGGGSNTLFTKDFDGSVIKINIRNINIVSENENSVEIEIGAGESWNGLVQYAVNNGFAGIENLTLIPGTVGAAPVQNISAYGQNFEDVFLSLEALNTESLEVEIFDKDKCKFGYRDSFFKNEGKGKYVILKVKIKLEKKLEINTEYQSRYESLKGELESFTVPPYTIRDVSRAVSQIRFRKFPDWEKNGTAGSFFLNPIITKEKLAEIQKKLPEVQFYPTENENQVKIAAGWLLEELGWKGKKVGNVGTSPNQSLVVMTFGPVKAQEILDFTKNMQDDFEKNFGIPLEPEVNIIQ